ncbi:hypothetical protein V8U11_15985 [Pseudomonas chlororaphis]|uniref:hypothetical protein n=1 Tax=Pseudomonas chlororaphis TaxID=587753 RepID=UPI0030D376A0
MAKSILSLNYKKQSVEINVEDIPVNPLVAEAVEVIVWDYTPEEEFAPRQRKRRKDREVEQYRKEAKWQ